MSTFAAIDFETANYRADSACALGIVLASGGRIVRREQHLIQPPAAEFTFTGIHGLAWTDVCRAPTFAALWRQLGLGQMLAGVDFLAAHNASFDKAVLAACCCRYELCQPATPFVCTMELARRLWRIYPTKLPDVCRYLDIPLSHHEAESDAEACARIVLAAEKAGWHR